MEQFAKINTLCKIGVEMIRHLLPDQRQNMRDINSIVICFDPQINFRDSGIGQWEINKLQEKCILKYNIKK